MGKNASEKRRSADILPGPGRVGDPTVLGRVLDQAASTMLGGLEGAADCRAAAAELAETGLSVEARTRRFAQVLEAMARPLVDEILALYLRECRALRLEPAQVRPLLDERLDTVVDYFRNLLRAHAADFGVGETGDRAIASAEAALQRTIENQVNRKLGTGGGN